jgi:hypothetical protein
MFSTGLSSGDQGGSGRWGMLRWIKTGELRAIDIGKGWRIADADLERFLRARETSPRGGGTASRLAPQRTGRGDAPLLSHRPCSRPK